MHVDVDLVASRKSIGEPVTRGPPTGLKLICKITTNGYCISVCHHKGFTYVGCEDGSIVRIDRDGKHQIHFNVSGKVMAIVAHQDRLYCLIHFSSNRANIVIYDVFGNQRTSWNHPAMSGSWGSHMSLIEVPDERLVVGNQSGGGQLIIYNLSGAVINKMSLANRGITSIGPHFIISSCTAKDVVLANGFGLVSRIQLADGTVTWSTSSLKNPRGLVLKDQYLLVSSYDSSLSVVDIETGKHVSDFKLLN